jgi:hypothetical protein
MNSMFCAEQIVIPPELGTIMKLFTKAAIREQPKDLYKWSANYFAEQSGQVKPFDNRGQLIAPQRTATTGSTGGMVTDVISDAAGFEPVPQDQANQIINTLFEQYDQNGNGRLDASELPALIQDLKVSLGLELSEDQIGEFLNMLDTDEDGTIDLAEFRALFFPHEDDIAEGSHGVQPL